MGEAAAATATTTGPGTLGVLGGRVGRKEGGRGWGGGRGSPQAHSPAASLGSGEAVAPARQGEARQGEAPPGLSLGSGLLPPSGSSAGRAGGGGEQTTAADQGAK